MRSKGISDGGRSVVSTNTNCSISDVEELQSRTFPGVLGLALDSPDESNLSEVEDVIIDDVDISASVHHNPVNI